MSVIRVLVVEDSLTIRRQIVETIGAAPGFEVVGEAADGRAAIEMCGRLRPDVITMDMMLPVMTGLAATEYIMAFFPTPILIVSASTNRGELFKTYDALAAGAVDVLEKPTGRELREAWMEELVATLRIVARIPVISHPRARLGWMGQKHAEPNRSSTDSPDAGAGSAAASRGIPRVIAIGASTGGPGAVLQVLRALPRGFGVPILLVIHISEPFGQALADWLDCQTALSVRYPRDGERLPAPSQGHVFMAPPGLHLELEGARLSLSSAPERHSCRPSVDVLFDSVARHAGAGAMACLLTGMGRDGAAGMLSVRQGGGITIAQDEETCVVFGMPGEAVKLGGVEHVMPLSRIGPYLAHVAERRAGDGDR